VYTVSIFNLIFSSNKRMLPSTSD